LFSKELQMLDENTVQYMIDDMQDKIDEQAVTIDELQSSNQEQASTINELLQKLQKLEEELTSKE
ncbi:MAG: hypothetical protein PUA59_00300, partial [Clostridium sp.]|nr:hypothetical protein [Clostridium sp.]